MNKYSMDIYIFGECRSIYFEAKETLEEIKKDWSLREKYALEYLENAFIVQETLEQV